jgi:hypothetical protein
MGGLHYGRLGRWPGASKIVLAMGWMPSSLCRKHIFLVCYDIGVFSSDFRIIRGKKPPNFF